MSEQQTKASNTSSIAAGGTEAMPPHPARTLDPDYVAHDDGYHSHKHQHGTTDQHYHRHRHAAGDTAHTHAADNPIHAEHPDHRRQHVGG